MSNNFHLRTTILHTIVRSTTTSNVEHNEILGLLCEHSDFYPDCELLQFPAGPYCSMFHLNDIGERQLVTSCCRTRHQLC